MEKRDERPHDRGRSPTTKPRWPDRAETPPPDDLPARAGAVGSEGGSEGIELAMPRGRRGSGWRSGSRGF
ncbi:MAG TPA: hypothetical protein VIL25_07765 [Vicinamibacterales bacterium]